MLVWVYVFVERCPFTGGDFSFVFIYVLFEFMFVLFMCYLNFGDTLLMAFGLISILVCVLCRSLCCLKGTPFSVGEKSFQKKNLNASRPSEHPLVRGKYHRLPRQNVMAFNRVPLLWY